MKTTQTSKEAYAQIDKAHSQNQVYFSLIALGGKATCREIAEHLKKYPNEITGRLNELSGFGKVKVKKRNGEICKRKCKISGKNAQEWVLV